MMMSGLWRYGDKAPEGKYLVTRRDGSVPEWPHMVFGAKDPAAPAALLAYANAAETLGFDPVYVADVRRMAGEFAAYCATHGKGDPDAPPHRKDDPATLEKMRGGHGA
jgi:hypothetical protein